MRFTAVLAVVLCVGLVVFPAPARAEKSPVDEVGLDLGVDAIELDDAAESAAPSLARVRALKAERLARAKMTPTAAAATAKTSVVDCSKGQSIQAAIDKDVGPLDIEIKGICNENVRIERKQVTLRGVDPTLDGIRGVAATPSVPGLSIFYSDGVVIQDLSISDGPAVGVGMFFSQVTMERCRIANNASTGMNVSSASFLNALELTISNNVGRGLNVQRGAITFCTGCTLTDNVSNAAFATLNGTLTLLDSAVSGRHGIVANFGSYADIDCVSSPTTSVTCGMNVTGRAAFALGGATAALFGAGDFSGQLIAVDRGLVYLFGARQVAPGTNPGGFPVPNNVGGFGTLQAEPFVDELDVAHQSQLKGATGVNTFGRALLLGETVVDGSLTCESAGDARADPGVVVTAGGSIIGCEHASAP